MTRNMAWIGFLSTVLILAVLGITTLREPVRQERSAARLEEEAITRGIDLYAENCVMCHGAGGEGLASMPSLDNDGVRGTDYETLFKTIERGRYNTIMAAYGVKEGGVFYDAQIESLVTLIFAGDWNVTALRVEELGLTPPEIVVVEVSEEMLAQVQQLANGEVLASGLLIYAENCAACHGANGEGTALAPVFDPVDLAIRYNADGLTRIIAQGVPGTLMASWNAALTGGEIADVVAFIQRWDEVRAAGIEMPVIEVEPLDMSPETIAAGQRLFTILCTSCHGTNGYGTPMAPALNNQLFLNETPDAAIKQIIALGVTQTVMPAWGGRLTETDINAITALLRSWEPTAPVIPR